MKIFGSALKVLLVCYPFLTLQIFFMRHSINRLAAAFLFCLLTLISCHKDIKNEPTAQEELQSSAAINGTGHLKQTKTFSSDALLRWMSFQLDLYRANVGSVGGPAGMRFTAYTGIAAYESVVPGMPSYQSLSGQLTDMPAMPETNPGQAYYWPECLNAAMSYISKNLLPPVTKTPDQIAAINNFEAVLHNEFADQGASSRYAVTIQALVVLVVAVCAFRYLGTAKAKAAASGSGAEGRRRSHPRLSGSAAE